MLGRKKKEKNFYVCTKQKGWCSQKKKNMDLIKEKGRHYRKFPKYSDSQKIWAVWSGSALFAQTYLSENFGSLRYSIAKQKHLLLMDGPPF